MVDQQGAVYLAPDFDTPRAETDLAGSSHLAYWSGQDWCCAIGLQGRDVLIIRLAEQCAVVGGQLDRLDFHDGYDPGGLHRIEIHDLPARFKLQKSNTMFSCSPLRLLSLQYTIFVLPG